MRPLGAGEIVRGLFGNARYLRGQARGDYLMVRDSPSLRDLAAITIEVLVKPAAFRGYRESFVQKGTATAPYNLYILGLLGNEGVQDGNFHFEMAYINDEQFKGSCNPISRLHEPEQWYYVAGTYDGQRCRLYINGLLEAEDPPPDSAPTRGRIVTSQRPLFINNNEYLGNSQSNGLITGAIDEMKDFRHSADGRGNPYYCRSCEKRGTQHRWSCEWLTPSLTTSHVSAAAKETAWQPVERRQRASTST